LRQETMPIKKPPEEEAKNDGERNKTHEQIPSLSTKEEKSGVVRTNGI